LANNSVLIVNSIALLTALLITVAATPAVRKIALRWKLGDKPNGRKIHTHLIPHLGGIAIVLGTISGLVVARFLASPSGGGEWNLLFRKMLPGVALIAALGMVDDVKSLRALQKLTIQVVGALVLALSGFVLLTGIPAVDAVNSVVLIISVLFLVGISSSVNLIDGHDGLATGICLIAAASFAFMAVNFQADMVLVIALALCGACLGFLVFNFPPGKIFMGDTGSMFLGIMLALVACSLTMINPTVQTFIAICFILGVPMLDAFLAIARRLILRSSVFKADSLHMHHVLRELSFSPRQVLLVMCAMQAFLATLGLLVMEGFVFPIVIGVAFVVIVFVSYLRVMVVSGANRSTSTSTKLSAASSIPSLKSNIPRQKASIGR
jgi:UDP-GlcNAc:undecaprenyl-phosphate GlcNAc-1-phosphate transferase